jgi:hypothetical protein
LSTASREAKSVYEGGPGTSTFSSAVDSRPLVHHRRPAELVWLARHAVYGLAGLLAALHTGGLSFPRSVDNQFIRFTRHSPDIQSGFAAAQLLQGRNNPTQHMKTQL